MADKEYPKNVDRRLKIRVVDFWPNHHPPTDPILCYLQEHHNVEILSSDGNDIQDLLYCSVMGNDKEKYTCKKLLFSGENYLRDGGNGAFIDLSEFDYVFMTNTRESINTPSDTHHVHVPWMMYETPSSKIFEERRSRGVIKPEHLKWKKFCCFIVSNGSIGEGCEERDEMFQTLMKYKHVDSAGLHLQNTEELAPVEGFIDWISQYKFIICFENSFSPGYITEKISRAYRARIIPIYSSNPSVTTWLNADSMVFHSPGTEIQTLAETIIKLDQNDDLYCTMVNSDPFTSAGNTLFNWNRIQLELDAIIYSFKDEC